MDVDVIIPKDTSVNVAGSYMMVVSVEGPDVNSANVEMFNCAGLAVTPSSLLPYTLILYGVFGVRSGIVYGSALSCKEKLISNTFCSGVVEVAGKFTLTI